MPKCPECNSPRVTKGNILDSEGANVVFFRPEGKRFLRFTLRAGVRLNREAYACLNCGSVWGSVRPDELAVFIRKYCGQEPEIPET